MAQQLESVPIEIVRALLAFSNLAVEEAALIELARGLAEQMAAPQTFDSLEDLEITQLVPAFQFDPSWD